MVTKNSEGSHDYQVIRQTTKVSQTIEKSYWKIEFTGNRNG